MAINITNDKKGKYQSWEASLEPYSNQVSETMYGFDFDATGYGSDKEECIKELKNALIHLKKDIDQTIQKLELNLI